MESKEKQMSTLIVPDAVPPVFEDCEQMREAFTGLGTNEGLIISILGHRNAEQRKLIGQTYAEAYGEDLLKELDKELSNDFEDLEENGRHLGREEEGQGAAVFVKEHIRIKMNIGMGSIREVAVEAGMDMIVISPDHHRQW